MKGRERGDELWMVCDDAGLAARVVGLLEGHVCPVRVISRAELAKDRKFWWAGNTLPGAILLDLDNDLDWAVGVLGDIKRAHTRSPVVVISKAPDHEFGMKIVSQGISCFLLRDFDSEELKDVVQGLIKTSRQIVT
jgi:DNA-binding NtrC family response regulator